ncbi:MAG: DUF3368 domain-containing protein [Trichodesmium sp.]
MSIKKVVVNSSPLIVLFKSQQADLLAQLFDEILVPEAVWDEVTAGSKNDIAATELVKVSWARRIEVASISPEVLAWDLGKGESAVLGLALKQPDFAVIIDDRAARRCAQSMGIASMGTAGVILLAKKRGLIPLASPGIQALQDVGLWLSDPLIHLLQQQAGESE